MVNVKTRNKIVYMDLLMLGGDINYLWVVFSQLVFNGVTGPDHVINGRLSIGCLFDSLERRINLIKQETITKLSISQPGTYV